MSEALVTYTSLPDDLERIETGRSASHLALVVRISQESVGLTTGAYQALGKPERIEFLFGQKSRMLVIRGCQIGGYKPHHVGRRSSEAVQIAALVVIRSLGLGPAPDGRKSRAFTARLVEGALLIGPLPEAGS